MANNIVLDYTNTPQMLEALKLEFPPRQFLKDRYFPDEEVFATDEVLIEYKKGSQAMAPFVAPEINGKIMAREGYSAKTYKPAMIKPKRALTIDDLKKKGFGEALYAPLTPEERASKISLEDLKDMREGIARRKEWMAAEVLQKNALTMKHYTDDNNKPKIKHIQFFEGSNNPALWTIDPTKTWDKATADIFGDVRAMILDLNRNGHKATEVLMGENVATAIMNNDDVQKFLDNRRFEFGKFEPEELYDDVTLFAELNCKGKKAKFIEYSGTYLDDATNTMKPLIDPDSIIVLAPNVGKTRYGAITQIDYGQTEFKTYVEKEVPLFEVKDQTRSQILQSAPLMMPNEFCPFRVAKVL